MRRGTYENHWDKGPENWVNSNARFSRGNRRPTFHGYNQRSPAPRHWRPDGNYRPRVPSWNAPFSTSQQFAVHPLPLTPHVPHPRFSWNPSRPPSLLPTPPDSEFHQTKDKSKSSQAFGLPTDNLHETINTVKQKLRERKASETNVDFVSDSVLDYPDESSCSVKASEKRRIEHTKMPIKPILKKVPNRKEMVPNRMSRPVFQPTSNNHFQKKSEFMRRKILKQLFKLDKETLRKMLSQSKSPSTKYDFALNSLIKETRNSLSHQLRSVAEKSLQHHCTNADSLKGKQIVQDAFMGHLGTMLDTDASLELSNMEPQVIAELSKVLQEDLMGSLSDEICVRSLADAMQDSAPEDTYSNVEDYQHNHFQHNTQMDPYSDSADENFYCLDDQVNQNSSVRNCSKNHYEKYPQHAQHSEDSTIPSEGTDWDRGDLNYRKQHSNYPYESGVNYDCSAFENIDSPSPPDNNLLTQDFDANSQNYSNHKIKTEILSPNTYSKRKHESQTMQKFTPNGQPLESLDKRDTQHFQPYAEASSDITSCSKMENNKNGIDQTVVECRILQDNLTHSSGCSASPNPAMQPQVTNDDSLHLDTKVGSSQITIKRENFTPPPSVNSNDDVMITDLKNRAHNLRKRKISETNQDSNKKLDLCQEDGNSLPVLKDISLVTNSINIKEEIIMDNSNDTNKSVNLTTLCDRPNSRLECKSPSALCLPVNVVNVSCQTDSQKVHSKSQGCQYRIKNCDASSQVYESLIFHKSKGTQYTKPNSRDRSCQTLKLDGLTSIISTCESGYINSVNKETQTDDIISVKTETTDPSDRESVSSLKLNRFSEAQKVDTISKPEEVLCRMRQIDNDIQHLMQEKFKLYSIIESLPGYSESQLNEISHKTDSNVHALSPYSKYKSIDKLHFQKYKSTSHTKTHNSGKIFDKPGAKLSRQHSSRERSTISDILGNHLKTKSHSDVYKTKEANTRNRTSVSALEHKPKYVSNNVPKSKSKSSSLRCDKSKHNSKNNTSESTVCETSYTNCSVDNIIPGKDINNGRCDSIRSNVDDSLSSDQTEYSNLEVNGDSKYVDSAGCPVTLDCNLVVSEEVVIKSGNTISNDVKVGGLRMDAGKHKKKSEPVKKCKPSRSSSSKLVKIDCDSVVLKTNISALPSIPPIKIRKKRSQSNNCNSQSRNKSSPLFHLISQLNESDGECDFEISNLEKEKSAIPNVPTAAVPSATTTEQISGSVNERIQTGSMDEKFDLVDCRVYLKRLDARSINLTENEVDPKPACQDSNSNVNDNTSLAGIINDETLFSSKDYSNDDCISLEQLEAGQFDDFCDPDVPSIISNMEVNDSFNIIDQWDSKLFENVSLLEDREIFSDKNVLDDVSTNVQVGMTASIPLVTGACDSIELNTDEPIQFTAHKNSIIALKCVGDNFLAASLDGHVYYYSGRGELLLTIPVSEHAVTCLTVKPNKNASQVYTGSLDSMLRCYNFLNGKKTLEDVNVGGPIQSIFQEWKTLYIGTQSGIVVQFDIQTGTLVPNSAIKFSDNSILALHAIKEGPRKVLLIASRSQEVTVKDAATGLLLRSFHGPNNTVYSLFFDSGKVYCGTSGTDIQVFDFVTGEIVRCHTGGRGAVCLQMYRGLLFTGCYDGMIYVFKKGDCVNPIARIPGPGKMLLAMAIIQNKIIAGCKDKSLSLWPLPKEVVELFDS